MMLINTINSLISPVETLDDYVSLVQAHRLHENKGSVHDHNDDLFNSFMISAIELGT